MKILQTGSLPPHWAKDTAIKVSTLSQIMRNTLLELGHEVNSRPPGSDINVEDYDLILSEFCSCAIMFAKYTSAHLLVHHDAARLGVPVLGIIGHNPHGALFSSYNRYNKPDGRKYCFELQRPPEAEWVDSRWRDVQEMALRLRYKFPDTLINCFPWGDHELIWRTAPRPDVVHYVDPTSMAKQWPFDYVGDADKKREWLLAAVTTDQNWDKRLGLGWPIKRYGEKKLGQERVTEDVVVQETAARWGNLCPPWKNLEGSGYWRVRYIYSAATQSIILPSKLDAAPMGWGYKQFSGPEIEQLEDHNLAYLAQRQAQFFAYHTWGRDTFFREVEGILKKARPYHG